MKMIAEYLEHALKFERMAAEATDPALKESLAKQAVAYRQLAAERATARPLATAESGQRSVLASRWQAEGKRPVRNRI